MISFSIPGIFWPYHDESVIATGLIQTRDGYPRVDAVPEEFADPLVHQITLYGPAGRTSYTRPQGPDVIYFEPPWFC